MNKQRKRRVMWAADVLVCPIVLCVVYALVSHVLCVVYVLGRRVIPHRGRPCVAPNEVPSIALGVTVIGGHKARRYATEETTRKTDEDGHKWLPFAAHKQVDRLHE